MSLVTKLSGVAIAGPVVGFLTGMTNTTSIALGVAGAASAFAFGFPAGILFWGCAGMVVGSIGETLNTIYENQRMVSEKPKNQDEAIMQSTLVSMLGGYGSGLIKHSPLGKGLLYGFETANAVAGEKIYDVNEGMAKDAITVADFGEYKKFKR